MPSPRPKQAAACWLVELGNGDKFLFDIGTAHAMDLMEQMYAWDIGTRSGVIDFRGGELEVHEFPFDGVNELYGKDYEPIFKE